MFLSLLLAQANEALSEEIYLEQLTSHSTTGAIREATAFSQSFLWIVVAAVFVGVILIPRLLNRMLNLGSILSIAAMALTAVGLPYALQVANSPTNTPTSAAIGVTPESVRINVVSPTTLRVEWKTDQSVLGTVRYGTDSEEMNQAVFSSNPPRKQVDHKALLEGLEPGRKYYITIVSGGGVYGTDDGAIEVMMPVSF